MPMPRVQWAIASVHRQVVERRLLAGDDDVDVVAAAQAVVGDREQAVGVRRQVDADDLGLLVDHVVDEARVLVGEAVVVLAPHVRAEQVVQGGDRPPPRDLAGGLEPLGVLVEHRVDDVDERLVGVEEAVPAGQQVALQPALAQMLGEHLHDAAVGGDVLVAGQPFGHPGAVALLDDGAEPVRGGLVGPEDAEGLGIRSGRPLAASRRAPAWPRSNGFRAPARRRRTRGSRASGGRAAAAPPLACGLAPMRRSPAGDARDDLRPRAAVLVEELLGPVGPHPRLQRAHVVGVLGELGQRDLVRAEGALDRHAVDLDRSGPALRRAQHDHRPARAFGRAADAGVVLDAAQLGRDLVHAPRPSPGASRRARGLRRTTRGARIPS